MASFLAHLEEHIGVWAAALGWPAEGLLRMLLAAVAGGLVGLEREVRGRKAGFRTNLLVCLGSSLVMMVSIQFANHPWHASGFNINVDPGRIAYSVMMGIGFLGAGTIIKHDGSVHGLTTAAAMWCVAAIGLAAGFGMYVMTLLATILVLIALWVFDHVEDMLPKMHYRSIVVRRRWKPGCVADTVERLKTIGMEVTDAAFDRRGELATVDITLRIEYMNKGRHDTLQRQIEDDGECQIVAMHPE